MVEEATTTNIGVRDSMRLRPSWVKRLSLVSLAPSSTRTDSPTPSYSNGSVAFSHDGSTAPIIGSTSPAPLPPNKLVKRSTSVRQPGGLDRSTITTTTTTPTTARSRTTLRRPATSHQRSQTWGQQRIRTDVYADQQPERWKQYFSGRATPVGKKQARVITRIVGSQTQAPTLVLANAVAAPSLEMDDATSQAGDSDDARSVAQSEGATPLIPATASETPAEALAGSETGQGADRPSRFFSKDVQQNANQQTSSRRRPGVVRAAVGRLTRANHHAPSPSPSATATPSMSPDQVQVPNTMANSGSCSDLLTARPRPNASFDSTRPHSLRRDSRSVSNASNGIPPNRLPPIPPQAPSSPVIPFRPSRHSIAASEHASTLVGSDDRLAFSDDSEFDFQSDTVFDSMRTRGTRASSGAPAPGIETIFDESPRSIKSKVSPLRDLLPKGVFPQLINPDISEEEESQATPVRARSTDKGLRGSTTPVPRSNSISAFHSHVSTPSPPEPLRLPSFAWDDGDADEDSLWSIDDNDSSMWDDPDDSIPQMGLATPLSLKRSNPILIAAGPSLAPRASTDTHDRDTKSSIFDWSEPGPERGQGNRTPPRPSTVHGKKDTQNRGGRPVGRRAPSGLHARSQSVPVVPDLAGKRDPMTTNKFGTWAMGSKGATEDWNDDFDFSERGEEEADSGAGEVVEVAKTILVPRSIREQQPTMRANIGLLREWFALIGELKELRGRATSLNILEGPLADMWQEVDAMIDLADQEVDDPPLIPSLSPPSSPGFDAEAFEEGPTSTPASNRARGRSNLHRRDSIGSGASSSAAISVGAHRRKSILPANTTEDIFSSPSPTRRIPQETPYATPNGRPRKNSEAVARSVIEALQQRRTTTAPAQSMPPGKKVPFDTATLKHIVPYVNGLMRKVKEALRETERLYSSPVQTPRGDEGEASFSQLFCTELPGESPSSRCTQPRSRINLAADAFQAPKDTEVVTQQLRSLTVV
ncbi:uncharacterized protein J3D65DRAFT_554631 [Phyllosticta citribraziliensis]|uniref:Uncharacterized protein n=1 Tax=Phyllosticta citribraziliensis TaxID=989973 RepID=A0ABR1LME7_9PEZI